MKETAIFEKFISEKGLRHSKPRELIIQTFLNMEKHVTIDELWVEVKKKYPSVGYATVYRTMKLLHESQLCREIRFEEGTTLYEHLYGHNHHDHLICTQCGLLVEVVEEEIEKLQERLMKRHGFLPQSHRMNLYGICKDCRTSAHSTATPRMPSKRKAGEQ
jgi:Fur family transcriptional regulator, ferric uptake regulator